MTNTTLPQYASTADPAVIEVVERNRLGALDHHRRAVEFAQEQGVEDGAYYPSNFAGSHAIRAIGGKNKPTTGKWKKGYGGYGWLPFKNNPLSDVLEAIRFEKEPVPGLPAMVHGTYHANGSETVMSPRPFVQDGVAYVGFSEKPQDSGDAWRETDATADWVEIKASEYFAAAEAYDAAHAKSKDD